MRIRLLDQTTEKAADGLESAVVTSFSSEPVRDSIGVRHRNSESAICTGRRVVGRKVDLATGPDQRRIGDLQPQFGFVFDDGVFRADSAIGPLQLLQPQVQPVIAFVMSRDACEPITVGLIPDLVSRLAAALRIFDSRVVDRGDTSTDAGADYIAAPELFIVGDARSRIGTPVLENVTMSMNVDGAEVAIEQATGGFGNPWHALAWLANTSLQLGDPLRVGEVVLCGPFGPRVSVTPGSAYRASISEIGDVSVAFDRSSADPVESASEAV